MKDMLLLDHVKRTFLDENARRQNALREATEEGFYKGLAIGRLCGQDDILKNILSYLDFKLPSEGDFNYKVRMDMCEGTEHVWVEALRWQGGFHFNLKIDKDYSNYQFNGALVNQTVLVACVIKTICKEDEIMMQMAYLKNKDGSFYSEGQLRAVFPEYNHSCEGYCGGLCYALPGDTIYWDVQDPYKNAIAYKPATDQQLKTRGWEVGGRILASNMEYYRRNRAKMLAGRPDLRFQLFTRVRCRIDSTQWVSGVISQLWYRDSSFDQNVWAPYKVKLDAGVSVYAPCDSDQVIKLDTEPIMEDSMVNDAIGVLCHRCREFTPKRNEALRRTRGPNPRILLREMFMSGLLNDRNPQEILVDMTLRNRGHNNVQREALRFPIGTRVLCLIGDNLWIPGEVVQHWYLEPSITRPVPYQIRLEDDTLAYSPRDTDEMIKFDPSSMAPLRFGTGSRVECKLEDVNNNEEWCAGTIVELWYWEPGFQQPAPYQINLDNGGEIYAPEDNDDVVRLL